MNPLMRLAAALVGRRQIPGTQIIPFNGGAGTAIYPTNDGQTYIDKGYNKNATVFTVVSRCAEKVGQIPYYHYRLKVTERKTYHTEYLPLIKDHLHDPKARKEARAMLKKSVEEVRVDSDLQQLINKPNAHQSGAMFNELAAGHSLLTGEGNVWTPREDVKAKPAALQIIPKSRLLLKGNGNPFDFDSYEIQLMGNRRAVPKENMLRFYKQGYTFDETLLTHFRGMSPLEAGLLKLQASNEADARLIAMYINAGVAGLAFREDAHEMPTPEQALFQRQQFNHIINDKDKAGSIAIMSGKWKYLQFGMDAVQMQLLEQINLTEAAICKLFKFPAGLIREDAKYENARQYERQWIYQCIAPLAQALRDNIYMPLVEQFSLDPSRDVIDYDILGLKELSVDLKEIGEAASKLWCVSPNEVRDMAGYERSEDPNMDKIYAPSGLQPLDQLNAEIGGSLDSEMNQLQP